MTHSTRPTSRLMMTAEDLYLHLLPLEKSPEFRRRVFDARARVEDAVEALDAVALERSVLPAHAMFEVMSWTLRDLAHDAFIAVLALGQGLRHPEADELIKPSSFEHAAIVVSEMLDQLRPYVSRADDGLRRVLLDDEPLESALERIANAR